MKKDERDTENVDGRKKNKRIRKGVNGKYKVYTIMER